MTKSKGTATEAAQELNESDVVEVARGVRVRRRVAIAALAVGALWAGGSELAVEQAAASPILTEVVRETERSGWPHASTWQERREASYRVLRAEVPQGMRGSVLCRWPSARMGAFHCGVVRAVRGGGVARYRVNVQVWEDGSFRVSPGRPVK